MKMALTRGISFEQFSRTTSAREVSEYMALDLIDPLFDGERLERAIASLTNLFYNANRDPEKHPATTVDDWIPKYLERFKTQEEREQDEIKENIDKWFGGK